MFIRLLLYIAINSCFDSKAIFILLASNGISSHADFACHSISNNFAKGKSVKAAAANILIAA